MKNNQKGSANTILIIIIIILLGAVGYFAFKKPTITPISTLPDTTKGIVVQQPVLNQEVQLPITVKGYINGNGWTAFEGVAGSVQVFDANNKAVSNRVPLNATNDWTQSTVYFETTVGDREMMSHLATQGGVLVFKSENARGDEYGKEFRLPIKFKK